jgi:hypothetical protein
VPLSCRECRVLFRVKVPEVPPGGAAEEPVSLLRLYTQGGQFMELVPGAPYALTVPRRLDLFAADALTKLWRAVPEPRRVVIDCAATAELSERGAAELMRLAVGEDDRAAVVVNKDWPAGAFPAGAPLYPTREEATAALSEIPEASQRPITVTFRPEQATSRG